MVANQRIRCHIAYLNNAFWQPSKIKLFIGWYPEMLRFIYKFLIWFLKPCLLIAQWLKYLQTKSVGHVVRFGSAIWCFQNIFFGSSGVKSSTFDWNRRYPVGLLECWDKKFQLDISNSKLQTEYFQLIKSKLILMTGLKKNRLRSLKVLRVFCRTGILFRIWLCLISNIFCRLDKYL